MFCFSPYFYLKNYSTDFTVQIFRFWGRSVSVRVGLERGVGGPRSIVNSRAFSSWERAPCV